ncbi:ribonuclease H-like domain-containing protein [Tanacetum coccineum]
MLPLPRPWPVTIVVLNASYLPWKRWKLRLLRVEDWKYAKCSSSSDSEVDSFSKTCVKAYATLKEQYDSLSSDYKKSQFNLVSYKVGLESVEARLAHYKKNEAVFEESINVLKLEVRLRDNALNEYKMNLEKAKKERDQLKQTLEKFQNSSKSLNNILESQVIDKFKTGLGYDATTAAYPAVESFMNLIDKPGSDKGYHSVPPPLTGNFIPRKPDLTFMDEIVKSENLDVTTVVTPSNDKTVENKGVSNTVESNVVRMNNTSAPIIEDWNSDDESEIDYTVRPSTEKIKSVKTVRETDAPKQIKQHPRGNQRNWNNLMSQRLGSDFKMTNKACYVCGSFEHLYYVCDKKVIRLVWNNSRRVNHKNFANKMTYPHSNRGFVPQAVLTRTGKINTVGVKVNTAVRPVNIIGSKPTVNHPRPISNAYKKDIHKSQDQLTSFQQTRTVFSIKRHMTRNKCYLTEYEDYDGGFVSIGYGKGRISGKGKFKTGKLDFDNVYFFLSYDFKLLDESQVLQRVPRKDNIYSVDLKSVDETSGILKTFITEIENQLDHKVKVIRCDNGTEFKNSLMNQLCEMKGIKREFSIARTPQQNGVAERKNRTLIEAARTMLVDSKLPTTFWAEAVNTACYVLNMVLVIKPHNKDHLGKFDEKADEGYYIGYSVISKAMRVFNKRTMIVEETLNIRFLENAPNESNYLWQDIDNIVAGPKDSEEDVRMKPTEVNESGASDKGEEVDQDTRSNTPISTIGPSLDNTAGPSLDNIAGTIDSTANAFEEHLFA